MRLLKTLLLSATLALPLAQPIWAGAALVTVTGEATVEAVPDMATISLGVTTMGDTAAAAMAANTTALTAVMARLKAAGIDDRDLQTSNLSLNPNWTSDGNNGSKISGYMASNQLSVRVRALDSLGGVLDAVISDGANTLNGISFDVSSPRPAQDAARKAAVEESAPARHSWSRRRVASWAASCQSPKAPGSAARCRCSAQMPPQRRCRFPQARSA